MKKERQLQNLLFMQSKGYAADDRRGTTLALKQKTLMLETLLKEKTDEISQLKTDRDAMKISEYREQISALQMECNRLKRYFSYATPPSSKMRVNTRSSSKYRGIPSNNDSSGKMWEQVGLSEEMDKVHSNIQAVLDNSNLLDSGMFNLSVWKLKASSFN
ncbi:unnamed protein product [Gongylonema pulchrum]|uniref:Lzipper-MIP1 domain-containing protein n=1 Tax=Gongylonema pulchrum TaxID=637853 RepID=A0A183E5F8_9BILA|nr:unnamed protein product [Gongylonema pulchrum]